MKHAGNLIIVPVSLIHQWESEIVKHSKPNSFKILNAHKDSNKIKDCHKYDIVITTYSKVGNNFKNLEKPLTE